MTGAQWPTRYEKILREHLPGLDPGQPVTPELTLADSGMDSLGMVDLLVALEEGFEVEVPDDLLKGGTFATAGTLWGAIRRVWRESPELAA